MENKKITLKDLPLLDAKLYYVYQSGYNPGVSMPVILTTTVRGIEKISGDLHKVITENKGKADATLDSTYIKTDSATYYFNLEDAQEAFKDRVLKYITFRKKSLDKALSDYHEAVSYVMSSEHIKPTDRKTIMDSFNAEEL